MHSVQSQRRSKFEILPSKSLGTTATTTTDNHIGGGNSNSNNNVINQSSRRGTAQKQKHPLRPMLKKQGVSEAVTASTTSPTSPHPALTSSSRSAKAISCVESQPGGSNHRHRTAVHPITSSSSPPTYARPNSNLSHSTRSKKTTPSSTSPNSNASLRLSLMASSPNASVDTKRKSGRSRSGRCGEENNNNNNSNSVNKNNENKNVFNVKCATATTTSHKETSSPRNKACSPRTPSRSSSSLIILEAFETQQLSADSGPKSSKENRGSVVESKEESELTKENEGQQEHETSQDLHDEQQQPQQQQRPERPRRLSFTSCRR